MAASSSGRGYGQVVGLVVRYVLSEPGQWTAAELGRHLGEPYKRVELALGDIERAGWALARAGGLRLSLPEGKPAGARQQGDGRIIVGRGVG